MLNVVVTILIVTSLLSLHLRGKTIGTATFHRLSLLRR